MPHPVQGVLMTTNYGDITIALYTNKTPKVRLEHLAYIQFQSRVIDAVPLINHPELTGVLL